MKSKSCSCQVLCSAVRDPGRGGVADERGSGRRGAPMRAETRRRRRAARRQRELTAGRWATRVPRLQATDSISERPVIAAGCSIPSSSSTVGATSASTPPLAQRQPGHGDDHRHRVERVGRVGAAVGLEHVVGVAVVGGDQAGAAGRVHRADDLAEAAVDGLDRASTAAGITPVWPTMSALAKLMIPNVGRVLRARRSTNACGRLAARSSPACGRRSGRRAARAPARAARPRTGCSSPPLKKYVTCGYFSVSATCSWRPPRGRDHRRQRRPRGARAGTRPGTASPPRTRSSSRTRSTGAAPPRSNSANAGSASARVISRIRSGRKLNASTESPGRIRASSPTSTGVMNSSVSSRS